VVLLADRVVAGVAEEHGHLARVTLESTPASGRFTTVAAPTAISDTTYTVSNGQITVPVPNMSATSAYHLVVQPTESTTAATHATTATWTSW
ncbi:hypothetical protein ACFQ1S_38690, partial [Kibdelosporangium lantanae]